MVLAMMGGRGASHLFLSRSRYVPKAPIRVARLPKIMSNSIQPVMVLLMIHPRKSPGMAAGVNTGRMVRASEKRT